MAQQDEINPSYTDIAKGALKGAKEQGEKIASSYGDKAKALDSLREEMLPTGDMNINNTNQLINNQNERLQEGLESLQNVVVNSPNILPVIGNAVISAPEMAESKYQEIKNANSVKQAELLAGAAVAMTGIVVDPLKKLKSLEELNDASKTLNVAEKAKIIEGDYLPAGTDKSLIGNRTSQLTTDFANANLLQRLDDIVTNNQLTSGQTLAGRLAHPIRTLATRSPQDELIQAAYATKPKTLQTIDARHHGVRGAESVLYDNHQLILARAQQWTTAIDSNPLVAAALKDLDAKGARALLNNSSFDAALKIDIGEIQLPKPLTQTEIKLNVAIENLDSSKQYEAALAAAKARLAGVNVNDLASDAVDTAKQTLTPGAFTTQAVRDKLLVASAGSDSAVIKGMAKLVAEKYIGGKTVVAAAVASAMYYADSDGKMSNADYANVFKQNIGTPEGRETLKSGFDGKLANSLKQYEFIENKLKVDGTLDAQDTKALALVASQYSNKIKEQGPESVGTMSLTTEMSR